MNRHKTISKLSSTKEWDLIIIGGGASGLGVALDAASRGLKTVLFEQFDFAKGTSSKSTKLVHGGVRYLAQGNMQLVKTALEERGLLAKNARHLFRKQEFIIPNYQWWKGPYYAIGLKLYDFLSNKMSLGPSNWVDKKKVIDRLPTLKPKHLQSGISYFDGQFDDARLAITLAQTAAEKGALILNYMKIDDILKDEKGNVIGVQVEDQESSQHYKVQSKTVVNAAGIFTDKIVKMYNPDHKKTVVPSQGIHLMLDRSFLNGDTAIMIPKTSDGRVLFVIPWHDKVIAGTTDTLIKKPSIEPKPLEEEVGFILETLNKYLTKEVKRKDVLSVFSGLRPLAKPKKEDTTTKEVSRSHKIIINNNMVSVVGGKWTTYRKMAEDVVDEIIANFNFKEVPSATKALSLHGNITEKESVPENHLYIYGSEIANFKAFEDQHPELQDKIHPAYPYSKGQVIWSIRYEMARTVEDFLARRIRLLLLDARAAIESAPVVAELMADELQKPKEWEEEQIKQFTAMANNYLLT